MDGAGQHEHRRGAGSHHPGRDPRRAPRPRPARPGPARPGPAAPRMPAPAPPAQPRQRSRQSHRRHRSHRRHGSSPQLRHQLARRRPAIRLLSQAPAHQRPQFTRQPAEVRRAVDQPVHEQGTRPGPERPLSASRVHQHRTQAEDVARRPRVLAQSLLRRQEPRRPQIRAGNTGNTGNAGNASNAAQPEPRHPRPVLGHQDVRGVDIPVHQPRLVNGAQPRCQPGGKKQQGRSGHGSPVAHRLGQRRPGHVRGGQPRDVGVEVRGDHRRGERPVHPAGRGDLGPEPRIGGHVGADDPHRDALPARRQAQEQPVAAQRLKQLVRPDRRKRNYHPESPLSVAATAMPTDSDPKQRSHLCIRNQSRAIRNQSRDRAVTRPAAPRNDFGTVRAYRWARSRRINDEVRGILSRGGD
jgi:hypothetical protein